MKYKVSELNGALLDAAVAKAEGHTYRLRRENADEATCWLDKSAHYVTELYPPSSVFAPSTEWAHGGPIIDRERISISYDDAGGQERGMWNAYRHNCDVMCQDFDSPLIAAMRAYVTSKLGYEVDL